MKAAMACRCSCGEEFLYCMHGGAGPEERREGGSIVRSVAAGMRASFIEDDDSFACPSCGERVHPLGVAHTRPTGR